jgi:hypothetical protein
MVHTLPQICQPRFGDAALRSYRFVVKLFCFLKFVSLCSSAERSSVDRFSPPQNAWVGHPHLHVIDNSTNFDGKMERIVSIVGRLVGLPQSKKSTARYLMRGLPDLATLPVKYEEFVVCADGLSRKNEDLATVLNDSLPNSFFRMTCPLP